MVGGRRSWRWRRSRPQRGRDGALDSRRESLVASTAALLRGPTCSAFARRDAFGNWSARHQAPDHRPGSGSAAGGRARPGPRARCACPCSPRPRCRRRRRCCSALGSSASRATGSSSGLGAWPRRTGFVSATPAAAMIGRRGLRARLVARAPSFVERHLPARRQRGGARLRFRSPHVLECGRVGRGGGDHERGRSAPRLRGSALARAAGKRFASARAPAREPSCTRSRIAWGDDL